MRREWPQCLPQVRARVEKGGDLDVGQNEGRRAVQR
jgi:hypothetical protein